MGVVDLQLASFILLLFTALLSIQTQIFQIRTSIRESLEQLDEHIIVSDIKIKPILHRFSYRWRWSRTVVRIKGRRQQDYPSGVSEALSSPLWWARIDEDEFCRALENLDDIREARIANIGQNKAIDVTIQSSSSVKVRRIIENVLLLIEQGYNNR